MSEQLYVLICERDTYRPEDGGRPIVFEQYIDHDYASLESVQARQQQIGDKYGKTRIAKLEFVDS